MAEKIWMTTEQVIASLKVTKPIVAMWRGRDDFPARSAKVIDGKMQFEVVSLKRWLAKWPVPKRGRRPSWFAAVGHKAAA